METSSIATLALAVRRTNHSTRSRPSNVQRPSVKKLPHVSYNAWKGNLNNSDHLTALLVTLFVLRIPVFQIFSFTADFDLFVEEI